MSSAPPPPLATPVPAPEPSPREAVARPPDDPTGATRPPEDQIERARQSADEQVVDLARAWRTPSGWRYFSAVNNTEVGVWYGTMAMLFFLFAGVLALLMRMQLAVPENDLVDPHLYNQLTTLHGSAMMFLFAVPMLEAVAITLLPEMIAARDLPFPRLSAFGFWSFMIGGTFVCGSIFFNAAPAGGWFMYPPLTTDTTQSGIGADIWLLGLSFIEVASIAAAVELIVGVLKCRPPGMHLHLMPPYAWYVLVVGAMILFAFPPLIAGDLLLELERAFNWPFFDPDRGGDPLLWQHLFWIFGHPEVYIVFLPSIALLSMIVPTFARTPLVGYRWVVLAAITTGFLSFGLWVHHMFTTGLPAATLGLFSAASEMVAIPTAIQIFALLGTVLVGRVTSSVPMLYAAGSLAIFVLGGLTGMMVAVAPFDWQAHDTYFVVAHLHYVLFGGLVLPLFGGLYYYYPKLRGHMLSARVGKVAFWLIFIGFNVTFLPMHVTGLAGMPRRVATYSAELGVDLLNLVSTVGAFGIAAGVLAIVLDVLRPGRYKTASGVNPWDAGTLEWLPDEPEKPWGVRSVPIVRGRYPLWEDPGLIHAVERGEGYLADAPLGDRETLITSVIDARPIQCLKVPGPSFLPMLNAAALGGVFIFGTFHRVIEALICALLTLVVTVTWLRTGTARRPVKPWRDVGHGLVLPVQVSGPRSVSWWGVFITMLGDMTAFVTLVFCYFYLWTVNGAFPPVGAVTPPVWLVAVSAALAVSCWIATYVGVRANGDGRSGAVRGWLGVAVVFDVASACALYLAVFHGVITPQAHSYDAIVGAVAVWLLAHQGVGLVMLLFCIVASWRGRLTRDRDTDLSNVRLYGHFLLVSMLAGLALLAFGPVLT